MFSEKIINWYTENGRNLPWRGIDNPYFIWLSEIILQQTRIEQGRAYYEHFINTYPTVKHLADASEEQILKSWQGLGYYSRARNLHKAARIIAYNLNGKFPQTYEGILSLPGRQIYRFRYCLIRTSIALPCCRRQRLPSHRKTLLHLHTHRHRKSLSRIRTNPPSPYRPATPRPVQPRHNGLRVYLLQTNRQRLPKLSFQQRMPCLQKRNRRPATRPPTCHQ